MNLQRRQKISFSKNFLDIAYLVHLDVRFTWCIKTANFWQNLFCVVDRKQHFLQFRLF